MPDSSVDRYPSTLDFKSDKLFPFPFQVFGFAIAFIGLLCLFLAPVISPFLLLTAALIFTARRGITFDSQARSYYIYNQFFFWKKGKRYTYQGIEKIYIHQARMSQRVYTMYTTSINSKSMVYDAYLKTREEARVYLVGDKNEDKLLKKLRPLEAYLGISTEPRAV